MDSDSSELNRLDTVAPSLAIEARLRSLRWLVILFTAFITLLATISEAPLYETITIRIMAFITPALATPVWLQPRYALYAVSIFLICFAIGIATSQDDSHRLLGWVSRISITMLLLYYAWLLMKPARALSLGNSPDYATERDNVQQWPRGMLSSGNTSVLRLSSKSFWSGHFDCRLYQVGTLCVYAKFPPDKTRLLDVMFSMQMS